MLGQRFSAVGSVNGAVAGPADVDGGVEDVVRVALLAVAFVRTPASWIAQCENMRCERYNENTKWYR